MPSWPRIAEVRVRILLGSATAVCCQVGISATSATRWRRRGSRACWPGIVPPTRSCRRRAADVGDRATADRVWIIDPRRYPAVRRGTGDWAVHVALTGNGKVTGPRCRCPRAAAVPFGHRQAADGPLSGRIATSRYASYEVSWVAANSSSNRSRSGPPVPRRWRWSPARPTPACMRAASTRWDNCAPVGWRWPPDYVQQARRRADRLQPALSLHADFVICRTELREDMLASLAEIW